MKTTVTMALDSLIRASAKFTPAGDRAPNGVDVELLEPCASTSMRCLQFDSHGVTILKFEHFSSDRVFSEALRQTLKRLDVTYTWKMETGTLIRVRVLDLLDTHWMLIQLIGEPTLKITAPDGTEHRLQFMNDGENLWAQFDATDASNAEEGARIIDSFTALNTKHEVLK